MVADLSYTGVVRRGLTDPNSFFYPRGSTRLPDYTLTEIPEWLTYPVPRLQRGVIIEVSGSPVPWARPVEQRLNYLLSLPMNWDGHKAPPPHLGAVVAALRILIGSMDDKTPIPGIFPTNQGGIVLAWHVGGIDLEIDVLPDGKIDVSFFDEEHPNRDIDSYLSENRVAVRDVLVELAGRKRIAV